MKARSNGDLPSANVTAVEREETRWLVVLEARPFPHSTRSGTVGEPALRKPQATCRARLNHDVAAR